MTRITSFEDALSVLALDDLDELDDESRKALASLANLEGKRRSERRTKSGTGDMVYKSEDSEDKSGEEFYTGPETIGTPMIRKLTRKSLNLHEHLTPEGVKLYRMEHPKKLSVKEAARLSTIKLNT